MSLNVDNIVERGDKAMRRMVNGYGVARRALPSYPAPPPWSLGALPWTDGTLRVEHQGFDLLATIARPGEFDETHLVRLRFDTETGAPWWHVAGDHLCNITIRLLQEQASKWPIPENWRDGAGHGTRMEVR